MASISGPPEAVDEILGLVWNRTSGKWVHPRAEALMSKEVRVADLTDEELIRGQLLDADGRFRGRPQSRVPKEFHEELMKRILDRGFDKLRGSYMKAMGVIVDDIVNDDTVDIRLRYDASKYVIERLAGKTPDRVEVGVDLKPWEVVMSKIIKEVPELDVIEAEVIEEDEE
jgi:hypothetical protein